MIQHHTRAYYKVLMNLNTTYRGYVGTYIDMPEYQKRRLTGT